jgi:plasmid stabilization system protein ParE
MGEYVLSEDVYLDLEDIWEYIAQNSPEAARRLSKELLEAFDAIAKTPGIGHKREDLSPFSVLFFPVGQYLIIYRVGPQIEIIAVTQGARDIPVFLKRRMSALANP